MRDSHLLEGFQVISDAMEEGIHMVDKDGITVLYNNAMEEIEGLSSKEVLGKHILEVFTNWDKEQSTLLKVLETGQTIRLQKQKYINFRGKNISTINTTIPILHGAEIVGAVELSRNYTEVNELSEQILDLREQIQDPKKKKDKEKKHYTFDNLIGRNKRYVEAIKIAHRAAQSNSSVLIVGETGTGKELFAQSIHYESNRSNDPFIAINCAAMPESLLESILFGTAKGSFTGAVERPGLFEQAHGGTLFLDEINSMSLNLQAKLLRVLQESYVRRIGGLKDIHVDVRIIAATNVKPMLLLEDQSLRKDLYYRINVLQIQIPSLSERPEDIPLLIDYFITYFNKKLGRDVWMLSEELMEKLMAYQWVGNVRELQNFIESALNMMIRDEHVILPEHVPAHLVEQMEMSHFAGHQISHGFEEELGLPSYLDQIEKETIAYYFEREHGNITQAAKRLKMTRQALQYKLKKYDLL